VASGADAKEGARHAARDITVRRRSGRHRDRVLAFEIENLHFFEYKLLTVYFGTPSMFISLLFGFDYGTNPPLGTLII
jgi:hypothetical protein